MPKPSNPPHNALLYFLCEYKRGVLRRGIDIGATHLVFLVLYFNPVIEVRGYGVLAFLLHSNAEIILT
jgi:hypothetical protein